MGCRCKQAEILAGVCGQREALERRVYEQDMQLEGHLDEPERAVQVTHPALLLQPAVALHILELATVRLSEASSSAACCQSSSASLIVPTGYAGSSIPCRWSSLCLS